MAIINIPLTPEVTQTFITKLKEASAIMQLARYIPSNGKGLNKKVFSLTEDDARWQTTKGATKTESADGIATTEMQYYPLYKIYQIDEQDAQDADYLVNLLIAEASSKIAQTFDKTVIAGANAPTTNFDNLSNLTKKAYLLPSVYAGLADAYAQVAAADAELNGWAISNAAKGGLLGAVDGEGRPFFSPEINSILGAPVRSQTGLGLAATNYGIGGDWTKAIWGDVNGIAIKKTTEGLTLLENNTIAVRVEARIGFRVIDSSAFVNLVNTVAPSG